jgi:acetolactate synthase I/III small subunit
MSHTVIALTVNNHAGVMSHITGLFARRAYNLDGILCGPLADERLSRMFLLVAVDNRLELAMHNLAKLEDVLEVLLREDFDQGIFYRLDKLDLDARAEAETPLDL